MAPCSSIWCSAHQNRRRLVQRDVHPKETSILKNPWHCYHESTSYGDDTKNFRAERYFDVNGEAVLGPVGIHKHGHGTFGFGRRACIGKYLANDSLFIFTATALWAAIFERVTGQEAPIDTETYVDTGMVLDAYYPYFRPEYWLVHYSKPLSFECKITPRFPEVPSILSAEKEWARAILRHEP